MRSVKSWRREIGRLSATEKILFMNAIETVLEWQLLREDFRELDLVKRMLQSEMRLGEEDPTEGIKSGLSVILGSHALRSAK